MSINFIKSDIIADIIQKESDKMVSYFADIFDNIVKHTPDNPCVSNLIFNSLLPAFCAKMIYIRTCDCSLEHIVEYYKSFCESLQAYIVELEKNDKRKEEKDS